MTSQIRELYVYHAGKARQKGESVLFCCFFFKISDQQMLIHMNLFQTNLSVSHWGEANN